MLSKALFNLNPILVKSSISKEMTVKGDIGAIYDALKRALNDEKFTELSEAWPTHMELTRGKGGLLSRSVQDCKTVLDASLTQVADHVNILLEYRFNIPASYLSNELDEEFLRVKQKITEAGAKSSVTKNKICDVCLSPIKEGENFCNNCGRSADRQKRVASVATEQPLNVVFDPNKIPFGQKVVDDVLYGGIPKNSVVLITSPACEEKDLIVTRFIETGLDQSETVVCLSADGMLKGNQKAIKNTGFYQVICNPQADLMVPEGTKNIVKVKGIEHLTELSLALTTLLNTVIPNTEDAAKPRRFVLDILSDMLLSSQSVNTRKWLRETITKFKVKNFTVLAILNPHMHSKEEVHALLDLFDGQIDVYEKEQDGITNMYMRVKRMNNTTYSSKEIVLIREDLLIQKKN